MHSVSNLGARKFGREDLPTIGFATRRILRGIEITSTRIRSSADWSREQLNIVAALRFQATSWMCGLGRARLQSCPSALHFKLARAGVSSRGVGWAETPSP